VGLAIVVEVFKDVIASTPFVRVAKFSQLDKTFLQLL
jgi:hypothetical protein